MNSLQTKKSILAIKEVFMAAQPVTSHYDFLHLPPGFSYHERESQLQLPDGRRVPVEHFRDPPSVGVCLEVFLAIFAEKAAYKDVKAKFAPCENGQEVLKLVDGLLRNVKVIQRQKVLMEISTIPEDLRIDVLRNSLYLIKALAPSDDPAELIRIVHLLYDNKNALGIVGLSTYPKGFTKIIFNVLLVKTGWMFGFPQSPIYFQVLKCIVEDRIFAEVGDADQCMKLLNLNVLDFIFVFFERGKQSPEGYEESAKMSKMLVDGLKGTSTGRIKQILEDIKKCMRGRYDWGTISTLNQLLKSYS